jgi:hypothetical protein
MTQIVIARRNGTLRAPGGERFRLTKGKTLADARHPAVEAFPEDWQPVSIDLPVNDAADPNVSAAEISEDELAELRTELAEAHETVEHLGSQFRRLIDGLVDRGVELPADEDREQGWLVGLVLAQLDRDVDGEDEPDEPAESVAERLADARGAPAPEPLPPAGEVFEADPADATLAEGTTVAAPADVPAPRRPRKAARPKAPRPDGD